MDGTLRSACTIACVLAASCAAHERRLGRLDPPDLSGLESQLCGERLIGPPPRPLGPGCEVGPRPVTAWGDVPRDPPPDARCPMRVDVDGNHVVAEPITFVGAFEPLPWHECVPTEFVVGSRHVLRVDDGFIVAYEGPFASQVLWFSEDGLEHHAISNARIVGFARAPASGRSGAAALALGIGRARLGRGAVLYLDHTGRGAWSLRLAAVLPIEPTAAAFDDHGTIVGYAERFVFRVDDRGQVDNVHYLSRDVGRVSSIARGPDGSYYLGLECGVLRLVPHGLESYGEQWWSPRGDVAAPRGSWPSCLG